MEINRRTFMAGSAAAVTAATLPIALVTTESPKPPEVTYNPFNELVHYVAARQLDHGIDVDYINARGEVMKTTQLPGGTCLNIHVNGLCVPMVTGHTIGTLYALSNPAFMSDIRLDYTMVWAKMPEYIELKSIQTTNL